MFPNCEMAYTKVFSGWPNASIIFAQVKTRKGRKTWKGEESRPSNMLGSTWERLKTIAQFIERFVQGQTTRQGIGWNQNKSVPFSKMSN